jgi:prophage regulatory protein
MADQTQAFQSILRRKQVQDRTGLSTATLYRRMAASEFPLSVSLGGNSVGWYDSEVNAWIEERSKSRKGVRKVAAEGLVTVA